MRDVLEEVQQYYESAQYLRDEKVDPALDLLKRQPNASGSYAGARDGTTGPDKP